MFVWILRTTLTALDNGCFFQLEFENNIVIFETSALKFV